MAVRYSRLSLLLILMIIILLTSQLSSCSDASDATRWTNKGIKQTEKKNSFRRFSGSMQFYTKTQQAPDTEEVHPIYGVSLHDVPGGPNPLHN
ncbi:hypothetical protein RYX36_033759 [Vicia faba]